ncbi:hypothetical protein GCM10010909_10020 [Acidocella aquatica]|uniref:Chalcone isomerase domain-containing protein n=1 Tax=Acidocella aquatica TaxID=1922313 RepID=A0ABQ6A705_9PROT|nr:chalcone isomerase family protein [Acidocella aquatica]GLR66322.1 hypothetical protein GCM10010909_10020 [Acidocella aquatica]
MLRRWPRKRVMLFSVLGLLGFGVWPAGAAQLAGVTLPDIQTVGTTRLVLNGIGLRTYSMLGIHIYVAGLYLQQPSHDADAILDSPGIKVVQMHFVHNVGAGAMRGAWRKGLVKNCVAPCVLSQSRLAQFLAALRPVSAGEDVTLEFRPDGAQAYYNGVSVGYIDDPAFARLMLEVFIGQNASVPVLKRELLGN